MNSTYIIAELGQNHNGSREIASALIDIIAAQEVAIRNCFSDKNLRGFNAVKTTIRDLDYEMSPSLFNQPYDSKHSFGRSYREHRQFLELSYSEHADLCERAKAQGLDFIVTICAPSCLEILDYLKPDYIKVASRDLSNTPLLSAIAETGIPVILSTGMSGIDEISNAVQAVCKFHHNISILQCTSSYPCDYEDVNLRSIQYLRDHFGENFRYGFSDHTIGILAAPLAVAMGAEIIEKHVTISRSLKGTDQNGSLSEEGMFRMLRDIRQCEKAKGIYGKPLPASVSAAQIKLERSICASRDLPKGHIISEEDLGLISPGSGIRYANASLLHGKMLTKDIPRHELILLTDVS